MSKKINVLSLFDGLGGARVALDRSGLALNNYYASEVDKYALQISNKNYPDIIQLGDITKLKKKELKKLKIDLLIGGSPCQGFSISGKMKGSVTKCGVEVTSLKKYKRLKADGFEFDGQSYLFWEYVRVLKIVKPKYFILENVRVTKKWLPMFNKALGVTPILINSALVSGQNRVRYYWTNIPDVTQPKDRNILLTDILEDIPIEAKLKRYMTQEFDGVCRLSKGVFNFIDDDKSKTQTTNSSHGNKVLIVPEATKKGFAQIDDGDCFDCTAIKSKTRRGRNMKNKSNCLQKSSLFMKFEYPTYRKLTLLECERLQTLPDNYTTGVSDTQRHKMIGNGFTIDVIAHLMERLKNV